MDSATREKSTREPIHLPTSLSDKAADSVTTFAGSWLFVGIHTIWFVLWITLRIEPFPYGLLTMIVSLEAIFLATLVMISQNRQASKDHVRDDLEADEVEQLYRINKQQLEILQALHPQGSLREITNELHQRLDALEEMLEENTELTRIRRRGRLTLIASSTLPEQEEEGAKDTEEEPYNGPMYTT